MTIAKICRHEVVTIDRAGTLQQAANLMREHHVGALAVTGELPDGPAVVGVVTDRDLAVEVLARGIAAGDVRVGSLARERVFTVAGSADVGDALQRMQQHGVRRLLVTDDAGQLVGIVALDDLLEALAAQWGLIGGVIRSGIEREAAERRPVAAPPIPKVQVPAMGTAGWTRSMPGGRGSS